jgi:hypothetical protein
MQANKFGGTSLRRRASRIGSALSPIGRRLLQRILDLFLPIEDNVALADLHDVRSILLVRPNFRLGNALITSPLIAALRERFPGARIDYLGGEGTLAVLDGLPIDDRMPMSRGFVLRPWRFVALFLELRRRRYDLAIEGAMGSFSGGLYVWLSGARHRLGVPRRNERFLDDAKAAGVDGLIVVDVPPEADEELCLPAMERGLNFIRLATPTTDAKRLPAVLKNTSGFLYYFSITGITGAAAPVVNDVHKEVTRIKGQTALPVVVGFGVRTGPQAKAIAEGADGVVVGSALVQTIEKTLDSKGAPTATTAEAVLDRVKELSFALRS